MGNAQSSVDNKSTATGSSRPTVQSGQSRRRPTGPNAYNFFDGHFEATRPMPPPVRKQSSSTTQSSKSSTPSSSSSTTTPSSRSQKVGGSHVNFFEVASKTPAPLPPKKVSKPPTPASSIQKSYTQSSSLFEPITPVSSRSSQTSCQSPLPKSSGLSIDGRAFFKDHVLKDFMLPCDDEEIERLKALHYILKVMFQGNFSSPIHTLLASNETRCRVLDLGCGAGAWTLDMASEYPNADFYGLDQCPLFVNQPRMKNIRFKEHDVLKGPLPYKDASFDFVYMRSMMLYLSPTELSNLLCEVHRVMKPGAYFEVVDTNYTVIRAGPLTNAVINTELKQQIYPTGYANTLETSTQHPLFDLLTVACTQQPTLSFLSHFVDIAHEKITLPLGYWTDQQIDLLYSQNFKMFLTSLRVQDNPLERNEAHLILQECERYKSCMEWHASYARKPVKDGFLEKNTLDSIEEFVDGFIDI
ncbi:hypothetical protein BY458DRAFT_519108 [Sporodiniella umbellata]|nr:hypothetical protein BY458DRAFT_519108 [Sporodiniella umbellata]